LADERFWLYAGTPADVSSPAAPGSSSSMHADERERLIFEMMRGSTPLAD